MWRSCLYLSNILFAHSITYFPNHYREGFIATRQRYCMSEHLAPTPRWRLETWIQRLPVPDMLFPETTLRTFQLDVLRFSDLLFWAQPWADHICQIGASLGMQHWSSQCATYSVSSSPPKWDPMSWLMIICSDRWIPVSREFEPHQRPPLFPWPRNFIIIA